MSCSYDVLDLLFLLKLCVDGLGITQAVHASCRYSLYQTKPRILCCAAAHCVVLRSDISVQSVDIHRNLLNDAVIHFISLQFVITMPNKYLRFFNNHVFDARVVFRCCSFPPAAPIGNYLCIAVRPSIASHAGQ